MNVATKQSSEPQTGGGRRGFFRLAAAVSSAIAAALVSVPLVGFVIGDRRRKTLWVDLGPIADFALDETRLVAFVNPLEQPWDGITAKTEVFVRNQGEQDGKPRFMVLSVNCAHLGCPVTWFPQSELFMCPCHGGVYYSDGSHASGPPPRGMFHCEWRVQGDRLEVQAPHYPSLHDTLRENG